MSLTISAFGEAKKADLSGAKLWADNCAKCHNIRDPQDYGDGQWKAIMQHMRIRAGLTGSETRNILQFLQKSNDPIRIEKVEKDQKQKVEKDQKQKVDLINGKRVYNTTCIACHGKDGKAILPGVPNFNQNNSVLKVKDKAELIRNVINGYQSKGNILAMPAKGGNPNLSNKDIEDVIEYLMKKHK